jgi:stage V sporulation protein G
MKKEVFMERKPIVKIERMHYLEGEGSLKAFCDLLILDTFMVKGLKIVEGKKGLFLSMPREQGRDNKWYDTFYPISKETRKGLEILVLENYNDNKK